LGTSRTDWQRFSGWVANIAKIFDCNLAADEACIRTAWQALEDYYENIVVHRRHTWATT
jgi:hypothetical protein